MLELHLWILLRKQRDLLDSTQIEYQYLGHRVTSKESRETQLRGKLSVYAFCDMTVTNK
jgi:hypothetical protein